MAPTLRTPQAYTTQHAYHLGVSFAEAKYKAAWVTVAEANPILRIHIVQTREGTFRVVVRSRLDLFWNTRNSLDSYLAEDKANHMGIGGSLIRFGIIHGDSGQRHRVVTVHHVEYDAWSWSLVASQVGRAYELDCLNGHLRLSLDMPCIHSPSQRHFGLPNYAAARHQSFRLCPLLATPHHKHPLLMKITIPYDMDIFEEFTISNRLRMAWAMALSHYTGREDVVFGATVSGRCASVSGVDQVTGPTIVTLPVRVQLSQTQKIRDLL